MKRFIPLPLGLVLLAADLGVGVSAPARRKPAAKPAAKPAVIAPDRFIAQLTANEAKVTSARVNLESKRRKAEVEPNDPWATIVRKAGAGKNEFNGIEELLYKGADWRRNIIVHTATGEPGGRFIMGQLGGVTTVYRETGHAETYEQVAEVAVNLPAQLSDSILMGRSTALVEGVKWSNATPVAGGVQLVGKRENAAYTLVADTPAFRIRSILFKQQFNTETGAVTQTVDIRARYGADGTLNEVRELIHVGKPQNIAVLTVYKVTGVQVNPELMEQDFTIPLPEGTQVQDYRLGGQVRYVSKGANLSVAELRALVREQVEKAQIVGKPAPELALRDLDGREVKLSDYRGKVVLLNWFASWCEPCNEEAPWFEKEMWQKLKERGVVVLGINIGEKTDPPGNARLFKEKHKISYPILMDAAADTADPWQIIKLPTNAVIDKQGKLRYHRMGVNYNGITKLVNELLAE